MKKIIFILIILSAILQAEEIQLYQDEKSGQVYTTPGEGRVKLNVYATKPELKPEPVPGKTDDTPPKAKLETSLGKGIQVTSGDEKHNIQLRFRAQTQAEQSLDHDRSNRTTNFQVRRNRVAVKSGIFNDEWVFYLQLGFADRDMEPDKRIPLRDASISYNKFRDIKFAFGQMKVPFNRQRWNSSSALQMVDRSIVNGEFNLDRDVGAMMYSEDLFGAQRKFAYYLGVFGGQGRNRGDSKTPGVLTVGRITYSPFGGMSETGSDNDWLSESDFIRFKDPKISFGLSGGYNKNSNRARSTHGTQYDFARFDYSHATAEIYFKWMGFSFQTEAIWRRADSGYKEKEVSGSLKREYSRSGQGYFLQMGYLLTSNYEISLRWGEFKPLGETDPALIYSRETGVALSYYFAEHNLKWQTDYFYYTGVPQATDGDHVVRTQLQVYY